MARAAEKTDSLDWAPEDAAFYSSSRRLKEQLNIVLASNAAKKIEAMPIVQERARKDRLGDMRSIRSRGFGHGARTGSAFRTRKVSILCISTIGPFGSHHGSPDP